MGGLGYGLGVSVTGLANVTTSDLVSCLSAADAGLGSFGTRSFVVVDCDTLTDPNFTTACMNALSELSGSGVILPPFAVFVRLVLHPETGEASVASQVISLLSLVVEIPLVGVVVRPVGYSPEGYIAPGYNLEPGLRAPAGVTCKPCEFRITFSWGCECFLEDIVAELRTSNDIVGSLPVWVQLSSSRDCEANDGPFAAVSGLGVGTLCDGLRNLGCGSCEW